MVSTRSPAQSRRTEATQRNFTDGREHDPRGAITDKTSKAMEHRQDEQDDRWSTDKMSKMHRQDEQDESDGAPTRNTTEGGDGSEQSTVDREQGRRVGG